MGESNPLWHDRDTALGALGRRLSRGLRRLGRFAPGLAPRPLPLRIVVGLLALPLLWFACAVLALLEVPSRAGGWLPTAAWLTPLVWALLIGLGIGRRWWHTVGTALVCSLLVGAWAYRTAAPVPERLAAAASEVGTPSGWRTVQAEATGSTWGLFGDYPRYYAVYATAEPGDRALARYAARLSAHGWERDDPQAPGLTPPPGVVEQRWRHDRWWLSLQVEPPGTEYRRFDHQVPRHDTKVTVSVDY